MDVKDLGKKIVLTIFDGFLYGIGIVIVLGIVGYLGWCNVCK